MGSRAEGAVKARRQTAWAVSIAAAALTWAAPRGASAQDTPPPPADSTVVGTPPSSSPAQPPTGPPILAGKLDLNRATLEQIIALPIPEAVARAIHEHRSYVRYFRSLYDVGEVPGVTPEILAVLRPLVAVMPPDPKDDVFQRYDASFRQVQEFLSQEGAREELADEYLDYLRDPRNLNQLDLFALQSFQNVSPVDAVAILKARELVGQIENERQLRGSDGLSYWGFRNLRDFVTYEDPAKSGDVHGDVQVVTFNTPYLLDERDILVEPLPGTPPGNFVDGTGWGVRGLDSANPAVLTKFRVRVGNTWKGGITTSRNVGEEHLAETLKGYVTWTNLQGRRSLQFDRVVVGNYRLAFGQGLVLDNTDFFLARKNGYGFNTRPQRLLPDLSRSQEFSLRGMAAEATAGPLRLIGFVSRDKKDGLLNPDGTINKYIVMRPRFENFEFEAMQTETGIPFRLRRDAFRETMYGGSAKGQLWTGTYLGVSGWEARYDTRWDPDINTLIPANNHRLLDARDSELFRDYDSRELGEFRRVFGAEFQTVVRNLAVQGEYAKLDANPTGRSRGALRQRARGVHAERLPAVRRPQHPGPVARLRRRLRQSVRTRVQRGFALRADAGGRSVPDAESVAVLSVVHDAADEAGARLVPGAALPRFAHVHHHRPRVRRLAAAIGRPGAAALRRPIRVRADLSAAFPSAPALQQPRRERRRGRAEVPRLGHSSRDAGATVRLRRTRPALQHLEDGVRTAIPAAARPARRRRRSRRS